MSIQPSQIMKMSEIEYNDLIKRRNSPPLSPVRKVSPKAQLKPFDAPQTSITANLVQVYRLVLPLPPSVNNAYSNVNGTRVLCRRGKDFKRAVQAIAGRTLTPLSCSVKVEIKFYRSQLRGDIDNRIKICLDSLTGVAFKDDEQVSELNVKRFLDAENPRLEVEITPID